MRLGFDAKRALYNNSGLGNYARILLHALMKYYPEHEYLLFSPGIGENQYQQLFQRSQIVLPERKRDRAFPAFWRSYNIKNQLQQKGVELYHGLSNEVPFSMHQSAVPCVVTIHDLIFKYDQEQYPFWDRKIYEQKINYAIRNTERIIAVSRETKNELIKLCQAPAEKITVVHPSIDPAFYESVNEVTKTDLKRKYNLPEKFILNVSSFFPRKNHKKLIEAYEKIYEKIEEDLVLVGSSGTLREVVKAMIQQKKSRKRIHIIENIANEELPALYQMASLFVYPSLYEGFGLPVLEALASRIPAITTPGGSMEEAGGKDTLYVNPTNAEELARLILWVLVNPNLHKQKIELGFAHAKTLHPEVLAEKMMKVYQEVAQSSRKTSFA